MELSVARGFVVRAINIQRKKQAMSSTFFENLKHYDSINLSKSFLRDGRLSNNFLAYP